MRFKSIYRRLFECFGYPLSRRAAIGESTIETIEKSLNIVVPPALRDFYAVAGGERRFSRSHNRVLAPRDWFVSKGRLVFMEENQAVVLWGVSLRTSDDDAPVSQAVNDDELTWSRVSRRCSTFLSVVLHLQAVYGGFKHCAMARPPRGLKRRLMRNWTCHGTVNRLTAYSRPNQAACVEPDLGVLVGGKSGADLRAIESDLGLTFE
ncbi:MAG: hypothetical protein IT428_09905 [Planctomycetaceae bacterium]|nr:hypothetical protein [Planctomycetaceae bacterium]